MTSLGSPAFDLLVVGELNPDVIVQQPGLEPRFGQVEQVVEKIRLAIGSSSAIVACGAARLGLRVAFVGVVGDDPFGRFMLEALADRGVDIAACRVAPDVPTGATVILSRGEDRAILTARGAMDRLTTDDVPASLVADVRHLHVGSLYLQPGLADGLAQLFASARRSGVTTSLDTNWDPSGSWGGELAAILAETDLFLPNAAELTALTGDPDPRTAGPALLARLPAGATVAIKRGGDGGSAARGDRFVSVPALPVPMADSTGAGDSFDAGFIAGLLDGATLEDSLRLAVACGSLSVRSIGGTEAQPDRAEAVEAAGRLVLDG